MIEVQHLSRYYGEFRAVDDVSFTIPSKNVVGFLGLNGAGKTTTLRVIAGLLPPSAGTVTIDGVDMATAPESFRKRIGFLPETPPLYGEMTVTEFLHHMGKLRGMSSSDLRDRVPQVVGRCQLQGREGQVIDTLSHGFRKRVGIAQAILHRPSLVILDEPISGLDPVQIVEMRKVIKSLGDESTVLVSSHILSEIGQTCDHVLVLRGGRVVFMGTEAELAGRGRTGARLRLQVRGDGAAVGALLGEQRGVTAVKAEGHAEGVGRYEVQLAEDAREALVAAVVRAGFGLRAMEDAQDELEEIFMDLTRAPAGGAA
jgi:ABC-2 type transport system ATP-binding protein